MKSQNRVSDPQRDAFVSKLMAKFLDTAEDHGDHIVITLTPEMLHETMWELGECSICGKPDCGHSLELQKMRFAAEREGCGPPMRLSIKKN